MKQEREVPILQLNSGDKLKTLQQLRERFSPFQDSAESKKLRALGLKNLYLQMADPSVDFIEKTTVGLGGMPDVNLRQVQSDTYLAGDDPKKFFAERGIAIDDSGKLQEGISNLNGLLVDIASRYDYQSGKLDFGKKGPTVFAERVQEGIQISREEKKLRDVIDQIKGEADLRERCRLGSMLKQQVLNYIGKFPFKFDSSHSYNGKKSFFEPTWDNLSLNSGYSVELETKDGGSTMGGFGFEDAVRMSNMATSRYRVEKGLEGLTVRNKEEFNALRLQYGAKAANLIILSGLVKRINQLRKDNYRIKLAVPDFKAVPIKLYQAWKDGKLADDDLRPYFEWANKLKEDDFEDWSKKRKANYIVRSSAVFSEDGENITGAGVYESINVDANSSFEFFKRAVVKVFESVNSPRAQAYRAQHGVEKEEMGLILQRYIIPDYRFNMHGQSQEGYINSKLKGIPHLMEIVTRTSRNFVKRKELDFFLTHQPHDYGPNEDRFSAEINHFPPDQYKVHPDLPINVGQLALIVEKIWGKDIQIEFVADGMTVNFVQVRDLPKDASHQASQVEFPDKPAIHSGASIGIGDMELPILENEDDNSEKTGAVIFYGNNEWTVRKSTSNLPKDGAVVICNDDGRNGHIQTLCAEKGIICVFPDPSRSIGTRIYRPVELSGLRKVRIVANGIEGRVYPAANQ